MLLITGFLFMVFIFVGMGLLMGIGMMMVDFPSALFILISLVFFFLTSKSGKTIGSYFSASFKKDYIYNKNELAALGAAAKYAVKFVTAIGAFGFLFGITGALMYLENPQMLGPNLAVSLITLLYAVATGVFIFLPLQTWAEIKQKPLKEDE